ncbi:MAG: NAD(+)/NADH kinase [Acidimicrobiales bacterium]|jgi:NAD+ kinase
MPRILLVVHPERETAWELAATATRWWQSHGREVVEVREAERGAASADCTDVEFAVSLGGDGTMLRTVEIVLADRVPVLGVNLGRMGYLTAVEPAGMEHAFERLLAGEYLVEERMALEAELSGSLEGSFMALNDVIVEKTGPGHTIRVAVEIAGQPFLTYVADGVVVSTPTGSTAYNLSARGPVVSPRLQAMVLTPVSPHMLLDRSLVLEPTEGVRLTVVGDRDAAGVIDGERSIPLTLGDSVSCRAAAEQARLVSLGERDFHLALRHHFGLTDH